MNETLITPAGLTQLVETIDQLRTIGRREVAERLRLALEDDANPGENADYQAAREEQLRLESRIATLERRLVEARVVDADPTNDVVDLGERVRLRDLGERRPAAIRARRLVRGRPGGRPRLGEVAGRPSAPRPTARGGRGR